MLYDLSRMPTRWTRTLIPTSRQVPAEAEVPSHQLMLRAGYIRKLGSGIYDYLPLGWRSLHKAIAIVRREMDAAGAGEVLLPVLQPIELWERSGRRHDYGPNLFVVEDRHGRHQALGPTHEEVITELASAYVESYRDLPLNLYQIQTKFRDEYRPRFGVLRSREFQMKDAYSFHLTDDGPDGLDAEYRNMYETYCHIFETCGLTYEVVEAESGEMGGTASHQFTVLTPTGEDTVLRSDKGNYAANLEKCAIGDRTYNFSEPATESLQQVATPGCTSIDDVCAYFEKYLGSQRKTQSMLKTLVYVVTGAADGSDPCCAQNPSYVLAVVRGDHDVNEQKLRDRISDWIGLGTRTTMAPDELARDDGWALGFVGPHAIIGRNDTYLLIDPDATGSGFWVTGANEIDHHVTGFNWLREVPDLANNDRIQIADIRNAIDGDPSPRNDGGILKSSRGIEIGQVFKLGTKYSRSLGATVLDENNQRQPIVMGCYGIGINRILASAIEQAGGHDENGIIWPVALAPYGVIITPIKYEGQIKQAVDQIAAGMAASNVDVLIDDRAERPGVKFKDADLVGIPLRITVGDKGLRDGIVEIKARNGSIAESVPLEDAVGRVIEILGSL